MALTYLGDAAAWKQITPPVWDKTYSGSSDSAAIQYQGPQYLMKTFMTALTAFQTMQTVAGLTVVDERGNNVGDSSMWLERVSSDDKAIMPTVTCYFRGCRGGTISEKIPEDDITIQSATTTCEITDNTSPNYEKTLTLSLQYRAARTTYEWVQLSDPAGTPTHATVRRTISYSGPTDSDIVYAKYSGMVDASGEPTNTISTGDATEVWNSFTATTMVTSFTAREEVPGKVWKCNSCAEYLLIGN